MTCRPHSHLFPYDCNRYGTVVPVTAVAQMFVSIHMLLNVVYTTVIFGVGMSHYYKFDKDPEFAKVTQMDEGVLVHGM